jgi:hypothetical protein
MFLFVKGHFLVIDIATYLPAMCRHHPQKKIIPFHSVEISAM